MKKIFTFIFLALTISAFGKENEIPKTINYSGTNVLVTDETPYIKEILAVENYYRLDKAITENKKINGFVKNISKEVEEEVKNLNSNSIIYKSYLFTKDGVKVRVLYIDDEEFKTINKENHEDYNI